jgi:hypothetical protein
MEASLDFGDVRRAGFGERQNACPSLNAVTGGDAVTEDRGVLNICTIPYGNTPSI